MSTWDLVEKTLNESTLVPVNLSQREVFVVKEAMSVWVRRTLDEASAWDVLGQVKILMEQEMEEGFFDMFKGKKEPEHSAPSGENPELTTAVKGLDPREVQLIRHFKGNAKAKTGNTGEVVALSPKEWQRIKQEIEKQPDYYDKLLGNVVSAQGLAKKIEDKLALTMGKGPSKMVHPDPKPPPELAGKPTDITPSVQGTEKHGSDPGVTAAQMGGASQLGKTGGASPFAKKPTGSAAGAPPNPVSEPKPEDAAARRRRVAAQDAAMMGGKTEPKGKVTVK